MRVEALTGCVQVAEKAREARVRIGLVDLRGRLNMVDSE